MKHLREMKVYLVGLSLVGLLIVTGSNIAFAQVTASISGRIEDPSGAAIPEAMITVTSLETGAARTATSDAGGAFLVLSLPVGRYEVRVEKTGFKAATQTGINLVVGQQAVVTLRLEVGEVQQQVTVTAEAAMVNTTTSSVTGLVGEREVKELPLNGRSFDLLITLNAGAVSYTSLRTVGAGSGNSNRFTVAGRRASENYFLLNGVELTGPNTDFNTPWGASGQLLGVEAIREFNVQTDTYGAEYGKRAGSQVGVVTQSGTNQLHGSLFEFLRNSKLDARNFFDHFTIPPYKRNQFGASAGGPIRKDRTFVFGNYEGLRHRLGLSNLTFVPDANARQGLLPNAQGVPTLVSGLQPGMLPYFAFWPEPNGPTLGGGIAEAFSNPAEAIREDYGTARLDHNFSGKDSLATSYTIDDGARVSPLLDPLFADNVTLRTQTLTLQETRVFSPSLVNTFTAGLSRVGYYFNNLPTNSSSSIPTFVSGINPGQILIGGGTGGGNTGTITSAGGSAARSAANHKTIFTFADQIQLVKGSQQISAGLSLQRVRSNEFGGPVNLGKATFATLQSFLQGTVASFLIAPNPLTHDWRQLQGGWFVQDAIQLRPNLTLRVGLRHEFSNGWNERTGRASNMAFDANGFPLTKPIVGNSPLSENNAKWLFSPRIGLAWDPFGKGKTSIRAGFGTYYDVMDAFGVSIDGAIPPPPFTGAVAFLNQPFLAQVPINPRTAVPPVCGPGVSPPCTTYSINGIQPNYKTPTIEEWNLTVEQQIGSNTSLRVAYVGSQGFHEMVDVDVNSVPPQICSNAAGCVSGGINAARGFVPQGTLYVPVATSRPNPYLASIQTYWRAQGNSLYNALQIEVKHRYSNGFELRGNYTWSKNLDLASGSGMGQNINEPNVMTPYNLKIGKGPGATDFTHQASISGGYELPFGQGKHWLGGVSGVADKLASGWQVNWIVSALSGFTLNPLVGNNLSGNGDTANPDRPSWNPAFTGNLTVGTPKQWFNPNAFIIPVPGTWGNVGRGVLRGPGLGNLDLSFFKNIPLRERVRLQFRAETFNILNHANFGFPAMTVFSGGAISPSAGIIATTATTSRQIQLGLKLTF
jgi:carboxypeptidase family protein